MTIDKKDPAFLFWVTSWLQSENVRGMTLAQRGAYVDLLCFSWLHGGIPADPERLRAILGAGRREFATIWRSPLAECWAPGEGGRLFNERQEHERAERRRKAEEMRALSRRGVDARRGGTPRGQQDGAPDGQPRGGTTVDRAVDRAVNPSTSTGTTTPTPPSEGGASAARAEPEPDRQLPPAPRPDSPIADLTTALVATRYRADVGNAIRRRAVIRDRATALAETGLAAAHVPDLARLADEKTNGDPGALLAHWLDGNGWREVLDEQGMKAKERAAMARAASSGDPLAGVYGA